MRLMTLFAMCLLLMHAPILAAANEESTVVILPAGTVHQGDYFAFGNSIEISGTVQGDVYVAGSQVFIDGKIEGDILVAGLSVQISGDVANNIRALGGQVMISGRVGHNVTVVGGNVTLDSGAVIDGNLVTVAGNLDLAGVVGSNATLVGSNVRISNLIKNQLDAFVGQMRITSKAVVGGNIEYTSDTLASIEEGAKVGQVVQRPSLVQELFKGKLLNAFILGSRLAAVLMNFIYTLVIGYILIRLFPDNLRGAMHALSYHPWQCLAFGIVLLVLLPLALLILLMTILGAPFALTLLALNIIGLYTAKIYSIMWASNVLFRRAGLIPNRMSTLILGLIIYYALAAIPYAGNAIAFIAMLFGLGAGVLAQNPRKWRTRGTFS